MANIDGIDTRTGTEAGILEPYTVTETRAHFLAFVEKHHVILKMPETLHVLVK